MHRQSLLKLVSALILIATLASAGPPALAGCAAPITPGAWSGPLSYTMTGEGTRGSVTGTQTTTTQVSGSVTGTVNLQVACDGTITGSFSNETMTVTAQVTITNIKSGKSITVGSGCTGTSTATVTSGSVTLSARGLPVFVLNATVAWDAYRCSDPNVQKVYNQSRNKPAYSATYTLTADSASATTISGTDWKTSDRAPYDVINSGFYGLMVKTVVTTTWRLNGPPPSATATPVPEPPVITRFTGRFNSDTVQSQNFLQGVGPVPNVFTAEVDWKNGAPGRVMFTLSGPVNDTFSASTSPYRYPQDMGALPVGQYSLTAVAINGQDQSSAQQTQTFNIAAVPAWAGQVNWAIELRPDSVLYRGLVRYPNDPVSADYPLPDILPYVGGPWGLQATQFNFNVAVSSLGATGDSTVNGFGNFALGASRIYNLTIGGATTAQITPQQLNFVRGNATVDFVPEFSAAESLDLTPYIPGLNLIRKIPLIGRVVAGTVASSVVARVPLNGQATLGVQQNRLGFTSGSGAARPNIEITALQLGPSSASVSVGGRGGGSVTFALFPSYKITTCFLEFRLFARYYWFDGPNDAPSPPLIYVCRVGGQPELKTLKGLAAPSEPDAPRIVPRAATWQPERVVARPEEKAGGLAATVLVDNAKVTAGPDLASGPNGQLAFAWVAEDPALPRRQANEIRARLFNGQAWGDPLPITHDTRPDFDPHIAFDAAGQLVVTWITNRVDNLPDDTPVDAQFLQNLEVAYAIVDPASGRVTASGRLTNDSQLDFDPHLTTARDGTIWLAWESGAATDATDALRAAAWDGRRWSAVETVPGMRIESFGWSLAAGSRDEVLVAAETRLGGDTTATTNLEIIAAQRTKAGWANAVQITKNTTADAAPRAAYTSDGRPALAWYRDGEIVGLLGDLKATPVHWLAATPDTISSLASGTLLAGSNGALALVWPGTATKGPAPLMSVYDPAANTWSAAKPIVDDGQLRADLRPVLEPSGALGLGYSLPALTTTNVSDPDGQTRPVTGPADSASLVVAEVPHVFTQAGAARAAANVPFWPVLVGLLCLATLAAGGLGLVFGLRRRQTRS